MFCLTSRVISLQYLGIVANCIVIKKHLLSVVNYMFEGNQCSVLTPLVARVFWVGKQIACTGCVFFRLCVLFIINNNSLQFMTIFFHV